MLLVLQHMLEDQRVLRRQPAKEGRDTHRRLVICSGVLQVVVAGRSLVTDLVGDSATWQIGGRGGLCKCHAPGLTVLLTLVVTSKDTVLHLLPNLNMSSEPFLSMSVYLPIMSDGPWGLIVNIVVPGDLIVNRRVRKIFGRQPLRPGIIRHPSISTVLRLPI